MSNDLAQRLQNKAAIDSARNDLAEAGRDKHTHESIWTETAQLQRWLAIVHAVDTLLAIEYQKNELAISTRNR